MKISMNIPEPELSQLKEMAGLKTMTMTDITRRAIRILHLLEGDPARVKEILLRDPTTQEIDRLVIL